MREQQAADLRFEHSQDLPRAEAIDLERERRTSPSRSRSSRTCRSRRARPSASTATATSRTSAAAGISAPRRSSAPSSSSTPPARTGAATRRARCSSASTAPPGTRRRSSTSTCGALEEAKKRDHRKLGRELDLFTFHPESPAAPFLHPRGMALWRSLEDWSREVRREAGFHEVRTPSLVRKELWETSGHWDNYQDNMFVLDDHDHVSGLKPMNCPEEILIYKTRAQSYRELPMRFADYSVLFRKERTGVLAGMFRVRQLTQDDSHVFCRDDQVDDELRLALALVRKQYAPFGFEPRAKLATRPEKRIGSDEFWERAEDRLRERLEEDGMAVHARSRAAARSTRRRSTSSSRTRSAASGRWRRSRPTTSCRSASTSSTAPPMAASSARSSSTTRSTGRFERFIGIITEHYTGAFPLWLAPVQVMVVPIADRHLEYAESVRQALADAGLRAEVDDRSERMQLKLRDAQEQKIPVMVVVGDRDAEAGAVSPRLRTGESSQGVPLDEFVADLRPATRPRAVAVPRPTDADAASIAGSPHEEDARRRPAGAALDRPAARRGVLRVGLRLPAPRRRRGRRRPRARWVRAELPTRRDAPRARASRSASRSTPPRRSTRGPRSSAGAASRWPRHRRATDGRARAASVADPDGRQVAVFSTTRADVKRQIKLTATGRRSGTPRAVTLYAFDDGENLVIVGSRGGSAKDPAWAANLRADPLATVQIGREDRGGPGARGRAAQSAIGCGSS